MLFYTSSLEDF